MTLAGTKVQLRGVIAEPNGIHGVVMVAVLIYTFAGFWVYWLNTGSTTIGDGGQFSRLGGLVWMGPLFAWCVLNFFITDRGPFAALYQPRSTIDVDDDGLSWWTPTAAGQADWEAIGGVSCLGDGTGQLTTMYDPSGVELGSITGALADQRTRRAARLPDVILEVRLDLFEALNPRYPGNGCVRRSPTT
jgi:hypothetical protein